MAKKSYHSIDDYIADFPEEASEKLQEIRRLIHEIAPEAEETISYNMPAFKQKKILVYFAAYENHIGLYALPSGNEKFREELRHYKTGKGSIQFPLAQELPIELIKKIVLFRLQEIKS